LALAAFLLGLNPLMILLGGGVLGMVVRQAANFRAAGAALIAPVRRISWHSLGLATAVSGAMVARPSVFRIGLFFLRVGAVIYGGGYVLLAFLEQGLVQEHAWLTRRQLLDAVAIGQFTPGPVFSTATFIGYILGGAPGAAVATLGIFLPSFFYVALLAPVLFRLRQSAWMSAFLDSVNVCAVALMAAVTYQLGSDALRGWPAWLIALVALGVLLRWKVNPAWVVLGGGVAGFLLIH
jgi:chromate transporter